MPNTTLLDAMKEAYACAPSNEVIIETIEIKHASIVGSIYLARQRTAVTLTLETAEVVVFEGAGFRLALPQSGENGLQELSIGVDNVDRRVSDFFKSAKNFQTPVECIYRPYLASNPYVPQMNPPLVLYLSDAQVTLFDVTCKATFADVLNKKFPSLIYTRAGFPSLGG